MSGEGVQEGIAGRVVGLAGTTEHTGDGREDHERVQVQVPRRLMQVPRAIHLGPQHRGKPLTGQRAEHTVIKDAGRVHHSGERMLRDQRGHRIPVGDITRRHRNLGTQALQLRHQLGGTRSVQTGTAGQQQTPHPTLRHQVTSHQTTQTTSATGHQHRPLRRPGGPGCGIGGGTRQTGGESTTSAQRELRLIQSQGTSENRVRGTVNVDQPEGTGILRLRGTDETQHSSGGKVGHRCIISGDGTTSNKHQTRAAEPVLRQPLLKQRQSRSGPRVHGTRRVIDVEAGRQRNQHSTGNRRISREQIGKSGIPNRTNAHGIGERLRVRAQQGNSGGTGAFRQRNRSPVEAEQRITQESGIVGQLVGVDRAREQPGDGDHGPTGGVDSGHGHPVRTRRGEADAQRGGAGGVQADALPRERKTTVIVAQQRGVQGGVEQRGMHPEIGRVLAALLGQRHLGIQRLTGPPGRREPLEERTVGEAASGETLVAVLGVEGLRTGRRPHGSVEVGGLGGATRHQCAGGVQRPGIVGSALGARVHGDRAPTTVVGTPRTDLEQHGAVL